MSAAALRQRILDNCEPVTESGCWLWTLSLRASGYGQISVRPKSLMAHRVAYELFVGPIPAGLWVLHKCDVRACVNPAHLFLGGPEDNTRDMMKKGRNKPPRGEVCGAAKLTEASVTAIRRRWQSEPLTLQDLADDYGVCPQSIGKIILRRTWAHVA